MQMAPTEGIEVSPGLGRMPLAQRAATLPGVSAPSRVVRSMQRMARSRAQSLEDFLIDRLASDAARSSAPTSSTLRTPLMSEPRCESERAVAIEIDYALGFAALTEGSLLVSFPSLYPSLTRVWHDARKATGSKATKGVWMFRRLALLLAVFSFTAWP